MLIRQQNTYRIEYMSVKIYHNPRCGKSRETLQLIRDKGIDPAIHEYLKEPLTSSQLEELINLLGIEAKDLVRTTEAIYKEQFKGKDLSAAEWIEAMVAYPKLMQRPIVVNGNKAILGRPPENVDKIL